MDAPVIVIAVLLDVSLLLLLAAWAARGGTARMVAGLLASLVFGAIVGMPVYAAACLLLRRRQRAPLRAPERAAAQEMTRQAVADADEERAEPRLREKAPARPASTNEKASRTAMEAAEDAKVRATTNEEVLAAQAAQGAAQEAQKAIARQATPKNAASRGRPLPAPKFNGVTHNARLLTVLASLAVGALIVIREVVAWVPEVPAQTGWTAEEWATLCVGGVWRPGSGGGMNSCPFPDFAKPAVPAHFVVQLFDPMTVIVMALIAAVVTFLALAAVRWAWRSYR